MGYWSVLWGLVLSLLILYRHKNLNGNSKNKVIYMIATVLTYFSAFRMELGQDYDNYVKVISENSREYSFVEPVYTFLVKSVHFLDVTEVLFFLIYAFITNFCIISTYKRFTNFHLMVVVYLSFSVLYFNTFNLVRQFCAASIVLWGIRYINSRDIYRYTTVVIVASLFHLSAVICFTFYFLFKVRVSNSFMVVLALTTLLYSFLGGDGMNEFFSSILLYFNVYEVYVTEEIIKEKPGFLTLFFNILLLIVILNKLKSKLSDLDGFVINMYFMLVIIYNLIPGFYYFHRLSVYFLLFFPLVLSIPVKERKILDVFVISSSVIIFLFFIFSNFDNPKVVSNDMKTFLDLMR